MKWRRIAGLFLLIAVLCLPFSAPAASADEKGNDYPIILVHGLGGWGPGEAAGIKYWGGFKDLIPYLNGNGYETYQATVGPFSSNYDRAVDLYYSIKGGTVDYGAAHAAAHGHSRYGRTYEGLYPEWDEDHPVHLVGHSMGGTTIRALTDLLKEGSLEEQQYHALNPDSGISPLFTGNHDWVHSNTTIGTPHNGSQYADDENRALSYIKNFVLNLGSVTGTNPESLIYDFKLDHWGLKRQPGERFTVYMDRVMKSKIWESEDISVTDLSTPGSGANNTWMDTFPDVYYFSHTAQSSYRSPLTGKHLPHVSTNPIFLQPSVFMGSFTREHGASGPAIDQSWWPNDGIVSVISSKHPFNHPYQEYSPESMPNPGVWNAYPVMQNWDHMDFMGIDPASYVTSYNIRPFYKSMAESLTALPAK